MKIIDNKAIRQRIQERKISSNSLEVRAGISTYNVNLMLKGDKAWDNKVLHNICKMLKFEEPPTISLHRWRKYETTDPLIREAATVINYHVLHDNEYDLNIRDVNRTVIRDKMKAAKLSYFNLSQVGGYSQAHYRSLCADVIRHRDGRTTKHIGKWRIAMLTEVLLILGLTIEDVAMSKNTRHDYMKGIESLRKWQQDGYKG